MGVVARKAAEGREDWRLGSTRCAIDGYGTIDLKEMASVQWTMVGRERPGEQKSTDGLSLKLLHLLARFLHPAYRQLHHGGMGVDSTWKYGAVESASAITCKIQLYKLVLSQLVIVTTVRWAFHRWFDSRLLQPQRQCT